MSKFDKLLTKLLFATSDKNFLFDDLTKILSELGFQMEINGSFSKEGIVEITNLQPVNSKAKPYQVKQGRELIIKYKLWTDGTAHE